MRALPVALFTLTLAGCGRAPCAPGTFLVELSLVGGAESADGLEVVLTVDAGAPQTQTVRRTPGRMSDSLTIHLPHGYPAGRAITLTVVTLAGGATLASAVDSFTAPAGCATRRLTLDGNAGDLASTSSDLPPSSPDLASTSSDLPPSSPDLTPPALCQTVVVSTLAGNGTPGFFDGTGGPAGTTQFNGPHGGAVDGAGNVYVADNGNARIRKVAPDGTTTTLAGNGTFGFFDGTGGAAGTTQFSSPHGVAVSGAGNVYVADYGNARIRKVAPDGTTTTLAGNGTAGFQDGTGGAAGTTQFNKPSGVAVDGAGNVYVADYTNHRIRKVAPDGTTTTLAGNGTPGFFDGTGGAAGTTQFNGPHGVAVDGAGNVYVADNGNARIRKVAPDGTTTTLAGNGTFGFFDGTGGPAGTTQFSYPDAVAVDGAGNVYVADYGNSRIRKVAPDGTTTTLAGNGTAGFQDGTGCSARFNLPSGVAVSSSGKLIFVAEVGNNRIRQILVP